MVLGIAGIVASVGLLGSDRGNTIPQYADDLLLPIITDKESSFILYLASLERLYYTTRVS